MCLVVKTSCTDNLEIYSREGEREVASSMIVCEIMTIGSKSGYELIIYGCISGFQIDIAYLHGLHRISTGSACSMK